MNFEKNELIALAPALGCLIGACATGSLLLVVAVINSFVPTATTPFFYVQHLNFPILSIALPVIGMLILAPFALRMAFARTEAAVAAPARSQETPSAPEGQHLKAA